MPLDEQRLIYPKYPDNQEAANGKQSPITHSQTPGCLLGPGSSVAASTMLLPTLWQCCRHSGCGTSSGWLLGPHAARAWGMDTGCDRA